MLLISKVIGKYKVTQEELGQIIIEVGGKYYVKIENIGNSAIGFIPRYVYPGDEVMEKLLEDLEKMLSENYDFSS